MAMAIAILGIVGAGLTGSQAVLPLVIAVPIAVAIGIWWAPFSVRGISGTWQVPARCHAQSPSPIRFTMHAQHPIPPARIFWTAPEGSAVPLTGTPGLAAGSHSLDWQTAFPHRGRQLLAPPTMLGGHPFGLVQWQQPLGQETEVVVLPALGTLLPAARHDLEAWLQEQAILPHSLVGDDEPSHVRAYRPGDSPRRIHWRASAHHRQLLVGERVTTAERQLTIALDTTCRSDPSPRFERLVSAIATVLTALHAAGWRVALHLPGEVLITQQSQILTALALVRPSEPVAVDDILEAGQPTLLASLRALSPEELPTGARLVPLLTWDRWVSRPAPAGGA